MIRTILFDLDDTLYPRQSGVMEQIRALILSFIETKLNLPPEEADTLRRRYLEIHGTTMRGLQINHQIDADEYLHYVHNIPLHKYLQANPALDSVLASIRQDKVIFTNASREHADRVLDRLGVHRHFSRIVDVRDMDFESKPQPSAYQRICDLLGVRPTECAFVEDNVRNLHPAKSMGMVTILVREGHSDQLDGVDHVIPCIEQIGRIPALLTPEA